MTESDHALKCTHLRGGVTQPGGPFLGRLNVGVVQVTATGPFHGLVAPTLMNPQSYSANEYCESLKVFKHPFQIYPLLQKYSSVPIVYCEFCGSTLLEKESPLYKKTREGLESFT